MGYDLFGQLFGKARRRKIEAAAAQALTGAAKPVAIDYGVLGTKLATAATGYLLLQTLNHTLPATGGGILTGVGAAVVAAGPSALQSSGVFTALSPNTVSAIQGLGETVSAVLAAPANARKAAFSAAVRAEVKSELEKTGQFTAGTGADNLASPTAPQTPQNAPQAPAGGQGGVSVPAAASGPAATDAAVLATGGNQ